jgi:hypothetical protein
MTDTLSYSITAVDQDSASLEVEYPLIGRVRIPFPTDSDIHAHVLKWFPADEYKRRAAVGSVPDLSYLVGTSQSFTLDDLAQPAAPAPAVIETLVATETH